jgi:hypothetical protein
MTKRIGIIIGSIPISFFCKFYIRRIKNMIEIWKTIEGYEDYLISNHGRVKSFKKYTNGIILKQYIDKSGYHRIKLIKNNKLKGFGIHRLVATSFIENQNPNILIEVNHIDEDKGNNHYLNLEWCTSQYNTEYSNAKKYQILFPDDHKEIIYNLKKFCRENNLNDGCMYMSFYNSWRHKGFKILEIIEKDGNIKKSNNVKRKSYRIICPDNKNIIIENLNNFCKERDISMYCLHQTFYKKNYFHKGFKIIEKIGQDGKILKGLKT